MDRDNGVATLRPLLEPDSVVVVGASQNRGKLGRRLLDNLEEHFSGTLYAVNSTSVEASTARSQWGRTVAELPTGIDLAVVSLPPGQIWATLDALADRRVGAVVLLADWLAARDGTGDAHGDLRRFRERSGIRVLGPNSSGVRDLSRGLIATFAGDTHEMGQSGGVDLISQSGGVLAYVGGTLLRGRNTGVRYVVDVGNEADISTANVLAYLTRRGTDRVGLILEGCPNWQELHDALAMAQADGARLVALQIGHSVAGREIAASHTGALVGSHSAFRVALERFGVVVAEDESEFVDALTLPRLHASKRVVVASFSGGTNALASDLLTAGGFEVPSLDGLGDDEQLRTLHRTVQGATVGHPIDLGPWAMQEPQQITTSVVGCLGEERVAAVVVVTSHVTAMPDVGVAVTKEIFGLAAMVSCPLFIVGTVPDHLRRAAPANVVFLAEPARIPQILRHAVAPPDPSVASPMPSTPVAATRSMAVSWRNAANILAGAGVPVVATTEANSATEAAAAAEELGFPVVIKVDSPNLFHRSRAGLVELNVKESLHAARAYTDLMGRATKLDLPDPVCLVQPQLQIKAELFIGLDLAEPFGPVIAVARGGTEVERQGERILLAVPVAQEEGRATVERVLTSNRLAGDMAALARTIERLSDLAFAQPGDLTSIELNPLCVTTDHPEGIAVDVLMVRRDHATEE